MVLVALLLRIVLIIPSHRAVLNPANDHFRFGWEMGRVARSIATGKGFSSPYGGDTGLTASQAPAYPYLLAGVFKLFGVYSRTSAIVILVLDSLFSSLTCWIVFCIAVETFGETVAMWSGWAWAFFPSAVYLSIKVVWETTLTAALLSLVLLLALRLKASSSFWAWLGFGSLCGLSALSCPIAVIVLPPLLAWPLLRCQPKTAGSMRVIGVTALGFLLTVTPWFFRNYLTFHRFIPFRTNFGLELQIGNNPRATGAQILSLHPSHNPEELEQYRRMGELDYMAKKKSEALQFIAAHPGAFALLTLKRTAFWWAEGPEVSGGSPLIGRSERAELFGYSLLTFLTMLGLTLAIRDRKEGALLLGSLLLLYPLVYYGTLVHFRYRHPVEPIMVILSVYAVQKTFFGEKDRFPSGASQRAARVSASMNQK